MINKHQILCACLLLFAACGQKQEPASKIEGNDLPPKTIPLENLEAFRPVEAGNWAIAGNVYADRHTEQHLEAGEGEGILVNQAPDRLRASAAVQPESSSQAGSESASSENLFTTLEHGDIDLELEFMMPRNSNSGIYLQGRYEVQLLDSWLKEELSYGELGGIYQGAGTGGNDRFEGKAPEKNAAKAPGLWQHIKIHFKAPRFDETGKKVANARFDEVYLNGVLVQKQVEVSEPTLAAAFEDEQALGPLMLQGDHGPVAFRNIRYKSYADKRIALENMQYHRYEGMYQAKPDTLAHLEPDVSGSTDTLSQHFSKEYDLYVIEGDMLAPQEGDYMFELKAGGPAWLYINDQLVTDNQGTRNYEHGFYGSHSLEEGKNGFRIVYGNYDESLSLYYEGPEIPWTMLSTPASARHRIKIVELPHEVEDRPLMQRGFMMHQGEKKNYMIAVGMPEKINYAYDLNNFSPLSTWHGPFLDVGEMWIERGESQLAKAMGAALEMSGRPSIALLAREQEAWPEAISDDEGILTDRGYRMQKNGLPVFYYRMEHIRVEDYLHPSRDQSALRRELSFSADKDEEKLYVLLGTGSRIEQLPNGSYAVNDKSYYIEDIRAGDVSPVIRQQDGGYELVLPVRPGTEAAKTISYSIIW